MLNYTRHFILLVAVAAGLAAASRIAIGLASAEALSAVGIASQFAIFGALHALVLVSSLTTRPPLGRQIVFIALAAAISLATAWSTLLLVRRLAGVNGPMPILIAAAALGAWVYAHTIRRVLQLELGARSITWISLAGAIAVAAAYPVAKRVPGAAALALAIPWWLAFSATLALQDARRKG